MARVGLIKKHVIDPAAPCDGCPLNDGRIQVPFEGKQGRRIFALFERPGKQEVEQGRLLVGRSGQLLEQTLNQFGLHRSDLVLANARKCLKEDETTEEKNLSMKHCRHYVLNAINKVNPTLIVPMGNDALQQITGRRGITDKVGKLTLSDEFKQSKILPNFHPAAILRDPNKFDTFTRAFSKVAEFHKGKETFQLGNYYRATKVNSRTWKKRAVKAKFITYDIETYNADETASKKFDRKAALLYWHPATRIRTVALCADEGETIVFFVEEDNWSIEFLRSVFETDPKFKNVTFVGHNNLLFDDLSIEHCLSIQINRRRLDTLPMAQLLDENRQNSLENLTYVFAPSLGGYDAQFNKKWDKGRLDLADEADLINYTGGDCDATMRCLNAMVPEIKRNKKFYDLYTRLIIPAAHVFRRMTQRGVRFNPRAVVEHNGRSLSVQAALEIERDRLLQECLEMIPTKVRDRHADDLRLTRDRLLIDLLYSKDGFRLKPFKYTGVTKQPSVDRESLSNLDHPFVDKYIAWDEVSSAITKYVTGFADYLAPDGRIHASYSQTNTVTWRTSASRPAVQQIPSRRWYADLIKAQFCPSDGYEFLAFDYKQLQLKIVAWLAHDKTMLRIFSSGGDIHQETAESVVAKARGSLRNASAKERRRGAKGVNFGLVFASSAQGFQRYLKKEYGIVITLSDAQEFIDLFFEKYAGLAPWHAAQRQFVRKHGYVESPFGHVRRLPNIYSDNEAVRGEAERQSINSPVQAIEATLAKLVMIELDKFPKDQLGIVIFTHDGVVLENKLGEGCEERRSLVKDIAENPNTQQFGVQMPFVPTVDVSVGDRLDHMQEVSI